MNFGLLLIPALGGYYLLSRTLLFRYWVARQTGYKLFFAAAIAGAGLLVSTVGSKCYIGFALESGVAAGSESDIAITPIASGYRDGETRELRVTRNYLPALSKSALGLAEFRVLIPLSQISSARRFDPEAYGLLRRTNTGRQADATA